MQVRTIHLNHNRHTVDVGLIVHLDGRRGMKPLPLSMADDWTERDFVARGTCIRNFKSTWSYVKWVVGKGSLGCNLHVDGTQCLTQKRCVNMKTTFAEQLIAVHKYVASKWSLTLVAICHRDLTNLVRF